MGRSVYLIRGNEWVVSRRAQEKVLESSDDDADDLMMPINRSPKVGKTEKNVMWQTMLCFLPHQFLGNPALRAL
jgi:hypothetical protein